MVWQGKDAVKTGRVLLGATNPLASAPGTIRGDFAIVSLPLTFPSVDPYLHLKQDVGRNVCHGSDSVENAKKEIALWFTPTEVLNWKSTQLSAWVYE